MVKFIRPLIIIWMEVLLTTKLSSQLPSPAFGTTEEPNISGLIASSNCVTHIVTDNFISLNTPPKNPLQVTITHRNFSWTQRNKYFRFKNNERFLTFCRFTLLYSKKPLDSKKLGVWTYSFVITYFGDTLKVGIFGRTYTLGIGTKFENFYVLWISTRLSVSDKNSVIYDIKARYPGIIPNFGILLLTETDPKICIHSPKLSMPLARNLLCFEALATLNVFRVLRLPRVEPLLCLKNKFSGLFEDASRKELEIKSFNEIKTAAGYIIVKIFGHDLNISVEINVCPCNSRQHLVTVRTGMTAVSSLNDGWTSTAVFVESENFHFLTCYSQKQIEFWFFAQPFDNFTWIIILLCVGVIAGAIFCYEEIFRVMEFKMLFSIKKKVGLDLVVFWTAGVLVEQTFETAKETKLWGVRVLIAAWILMATIVTNGYKSLAITGLNAPLPSNFPEEFQVWSIKLCKYGEQNWIIHQIFVTERLQKFSRQI